MRELPGTLGYTRNLATRKFLCLQSVSPLHAWEHWDKKIVRRERYTKMWAEKFRRAEGKLWHHVPLLQQSLTNYLICFKGSPRSVMMSEERNVSSDGFIQSLHWRRSQKVTKNILYYGKVQGARCCGHTKTATPRDAKHVEPEDLRSPHLQEGRKRSGYNGRWALDKKKPVQCSQAQSSPGALDHAYDYCDRCRVLEAFLIVI